MPCLPAVYTCMYNMTGFIELPNSSNVDLRVENANALQPKQLQISRMNCYMHRRTVCLRVISG